MKIEEMRSYKDISIIENFTIDIGDIRYKVILYSDNVEITKTEPDKETKFETSPTLMYKLAKRILKIINELENPEVKIFFEKDIREFKVSTDFDQYFLKCEISQNSCKQTQLKLESYTIFDNKQYMECSITIEGMLFIKNLMKRVKSIIKRSDIEL